MKNNISKPERVRLTHVITGLEVGGAEMMLLKVIRATRDLFVHNVVSLQGTGPLTALLEAEGVGVHMADESGPARSLKSLPRLAKTLKTTRPDLIQGWMYHGNLAASAASFTAGLKAPVLWSIRCTIGDFKQERTASRTMIRLSALLSRGVCNVIYNSGRAQLEHEAAGYRGRHSCVIPNGFNLLQFEPNAERRNVERQRLGLEPDQIVFGLIGRLHPMKDPETFLQAAAMVARAVPNAVFIMAGRNMPSLNQQFPRLQPVLEELGQRVHLMPEMADVRPLLDALDAFALTSAWGEGFSNALGEAMAMELPCITTDVGDCASMLDGCGFLTPTRDAQRIAQAMLQIAAMGKSARRALGADARARVRSRYSIEAVAQQYEKEWNSALRQKV